MLFSNLKETFHWTHIVQYRGRIGMAKSILINIADTSLILIIARVLGSDQDAGKAWLFAAMAHHKSVSHPFTIKWTAVSSLYLLVEQQYWILLYVPLLLFQVGKSPIAKNNFGKGSVLCTLIGGPVHIFVTLVGMIYLMGSLAVIVNTGFVITSIKRNRSR